MTNKPTNNLVIGIGNAGRDMVNYIIENKPDNLFCDFIAVGCDSVLLSKAKSDIVLIGENLTKGQGTMGKADTGANAVIESKAIISEKIQNYSTIFLLSGLGGGTGSGATLEIAKLAKSKGQKVVGLFTLPFIAEHTRTKKNATMYSRLLKQYCDVMELVDTSLYENKLSRHDSIRAVFDFIDQIVLQKLEEMTGQA